MDNHICNSLSMGMGNSMQNGLEVFVNFLG